MDATTGSTAAPTTPATPSTSPPAIETARSASSAAPAAPGPSTDPAYTANPGHVAGPELHDTARANPSITSVTGQFPALMQWSADWVVIPLWIVAGGMVIAGMVFAKQILIPLAIALLFACVLQPAVRWLRRSVGMNSWGAALLVTSLSVALQIVAGIWLAVGVTSFAESGQNIAAKIAAVVDRTEWAHNIIPAGEDLERGIKTVLQTHLGDVVRQVPGLAAQWILVMFMTFFFLAEGDWLLQKLAHLLSKTDLGHKKVMETFERIGRQFVQFMVIRTLINVGLGVVLAVAMGLMGDRYAIAWGVLATVLTYIPYIGPLGAAAPPVLMAILESTTIWPVVAVVTVYTVCFVLEGYVAVPVFMGKHLDLNATTVMIACLVWWLIWGEVGLVLAIPFTAAVKLALGEVNRLREWSDLMSAEGGH
jgi:predicted PurR-regulated permease PerM